ncbi:hypothetical protein DSM106972_009200 [Dulcicalothrix desertica PCC 7102]|uniref:Mobilization protein n=1 Tax=Dulcicalothrix desertica PCC 7102 TaxID=232991 RepID=A0A433VRY5_9CYAN|nr:hypothetical protein [Dulcicalothrix desertica]RUT08867.1 hypothetical protein DSM106972_009200 [Dulcicalothrix desertica PCC 7102]TWH44117.1 hypothetical protein CAL7102_07895 [Dulcicalothrix desertica PCC 7102]
MKETRPKHINARVTEDEHEWLQRRANKLGMTLSNYIRYVCLNADIKSNVG